MQGLETSKGSRSCPADLDEDGEVGPGDLAIVLGGFGYCRNCAEDLNGGRNVDEIDVDVLMESWGICPSLSSNIRDFCEGDFDKDGDIGPADLAMLLGKYGQRDRKVDLNGDNCRTVPNANQDDSDGDGIGDCCDPIFDGPEEPPKGMDFSDPDGDGVTNVCDNCPDIPNGAAEAGIPGVGNQTDTDEDGVGDACDNCPGGDDNVDDNCNGTPDDCECMADLDGSGGVGAFDLAMLLGSWGPCPGCPADLDCDGNVGAADLAELLGSWGSCQ